MSVKPQDQVELFDLLFGMNWEDRSRTAARSPFSLEKP